jgi:PAS domain S-box-containing protein
MSKPMDETVATNAVPGVLPGALTLSYESELILNAIPGGVIALDVEGRVTLINDAATRLLGWSPSEVLGKPMHDLLHHHRADGSVYPAHECPILRTLSAGQAVQVDADVFWRKDGSSIPVDFDARPILRGGVQVGALVAFRDGSERLRVEQRTRQLVREQFARAKAEFQHGQLRDILSQAPAAICVTRGARHIVDFVNEHYDAVLEGRPVVGTSLAQALPGLPPETLDALDRSFESARPFSGSETPGEGVFGSAGKGRFVTFVFQPLLDDTGLVHGLIFHAVDVTEQVRARRELERQTAELQKTTERFSLAAEAGRLGAWEWEVHAGRVIWSTELERMHGLEPGTFPGTFDAYQSDIHPEDKPRVLATIAATVQERKPHLLEYRIIRPDGEVRWLEARGRMFFDREGQPERLVGVCMDVTERKHAEQELAQQHRLSNLLAEVGMILTRGDDLQPMLQACAEAVVRHTGSAFSRIWTLRAGEDVLELRASAGIYTHLDGAHSRIPVGQFKIGRIAADRAPHLTSDVLADPEIGDLEWARREGMRAFAGHPLIAGNVLLGVIGTFSRQPLTHVDLQALGSVALSIAVGIQKKRHKEALRLSEEHLRRRAEELAKLASALERSNRELDAFAYAASHDLRAPLRGIANLAQWIEEDLAGQQLLNDDTSQMLQLMRSRMHRMEGLIEGLLEYSRAGRVHHAPEDVDVGLLVREVVDLLSPAEPAQVVVAPGLPTLRTERLPLQQIFLNLIGNGLKHARRHDAVIEVSAREDGAFQEFTVKDNGGGIPPEYQSRIWGIFQTLEARDKVEGTGIGLALVKKLVESAGGRVWVESEPGEGAAFKFTWPRTA